LFEDAVERALVDSIERTIIVNDEVARPERHALMLPRRSRQR
jgi:hypothetical protein